MQCYQMLLLLVGNLEPHPVPAVTEHPSDVPDGLRPLGLGVVPSIDGLAYQLHLALSLRNRHRGFPQRPRPGPDCPTKRKKKKKKARTWGQVSVPGMVSNVSAPLTPCLASGTTITVAERSSTSHGK